METNDLLKEILKWQKIQGLQAFKSIASGVLDTKEKRLVYEMSDGSFTVKQISEKAKVSTGTVSNWWSKWLAEGIIYKENNKYIKLVPLKDMLFESGSEKNE